MELLYYLEKSVFYRMSRSPEFQISRGVESDVIKMSFKKFKFCYGFLFVIYLVTDTPSLKMGQCWNGAL